MKTQSEMKQPMLTISMQTPERYFQALLHFAVYDNDNLLIAASIMGYASSVKAISAGVIEGRDTYVGSTVLRSFRNEGYRKRERAIGMGDVYHGMVFPQTSVWNDIHDLESQGVTVDPIIFAPDGDLRTAINRFLTKKYHLPNCWENEYYSLLEEKHVEIYKVLSNQKFTMWRDLKVARLKITEQEMLGKIEKKLRSGTFTIPVNRTVDKGVYEPGWTLKEFVKNNAVVLANKLADVKPYFDPSVDKLHWSFRLMKRIPFPAQAYKIQALVNSILSKDPNSKTERYDSSDMGTGKSITLCGVLLTYHLMKQERGSNKGTSCLLSAPAITLPKWESKEILPTIPDYARVYNINSTDDALKLLRKVRNGHKPHKDDIEIYMVGIDRAKLGHEPYFAGIWKRVKGTFNRYIDNDGEKVQVREEKYAWHCPDCNEPIVIEVEKNIFKMAGFWDFVDKGKRPSQSDIQSAKTKGHMTSFWLQGTESVMDGMLMPNNVPHGFIQKWAKPGKYKKCPACHAVLWRPALKSRHESKNRPRYNISKILKKTKKYFTFFAQDEVQQTKAESSGRGDAYAQMVKSAKHVINLTGTLTTGKSTSIKSIIWRANPQALLEEGFDDKTGMVQWASRYGVLREVFEVEAGNVGVVTNRRVKALQPKEDPGIAPALVVNHLLHKATFTELKDLGLPLVELNEIPEIIEMDADHKREYQLFHDRLFKECKETKSWGKFIPATINYGDRPDLGACIEFYSKARGTFNVEAPALSQDHAKMRRLIEIVKMEQAEGRGVVIYTKYSDKYGVNQYVKNMLKEAGIHSEILDTNTSNNQRFEWIQKEAEKGTKVLITNCQLVEVGLDLLHWPTIIYFQLDYDINKVRQSSRRAWRIGQNRECRVYYLVYNNSQQLEQFKNIMAKRGHAMMAEGRIDRSELAQYSRDSNTALAADIADSLDGSEVAKLWKQLASKDIDEGLELVEEGRFLEVLKQRMAELAQATLNRCLPLPVIRNKENPLEDHFLEWVNHFSEDWRSRLISHQDLIIDGIKSGRINGFVWSGDLFYFDEISVFGFGFADELAIVEHILQSIGISLSEDTIVLSEAILDTQSQNDSSFRIKVVSQSKSKKNKVADGQLALELF